MELKHIEEKDFEKEIKEGKVLVDFYADWCGPCKMMTPVLEDLADNSDVKIVKLNVDEAEDIARKYGIMSIPTLILFNDGNEIDKRIGLTSKSELKEMIEK